MRLAISGKGGSGKTTIAGTLARVLARRGNRVMAIDADPNPNLSITLGIPKTRVHTLTPLPGDLMIETVDPWGKRQLSLKDSPDDVIRRYGIRTPDDVTLLLMTRVDHAGVG